MQILSDTLELNYLQMKNTVKYFLFSAGIVLVLSGCTGTEQHDDTAGSHSVTVNRAIGMLYPTEGNNVLGKVIFTQTDSGVHIVAEVTGLSEGPHGIHIHQYGDCSSPDATSAGGHFNPTGHDHGGPADTVRHVGDLGNIVATADNIARLEYTDKVMSLNGSSSIIGRSIVIHAVADDLVSQPTGNAGARVACGVIGVAE